MPTAGYSGTPLPKKLGIKPGHRVALVGAPPGFADTLQPLPERVTLLTRPGKPCDVIVLFVKRRADLARRFPRLAAKLVPDGGLWVSWPKKSSGVATDLAFDSVQRLGLDTGLVDNKVCAIDETWSGLRFVIRVENRPR